MHSVTRNIVRYLPAVLIALALSVIGYALLVDRSGRVSSEAMTSTNAIAPVIRNEQAEIPVEHWLTIAESGSVSGTGKSERFRLAGTFFIMGGEDGAPDDRQLRRAIIDDLVSSTQHIVREGQSFEGHDIMRIYQDRVILRHEGEELELRLSFMGGITTPDTGDAPPEKSKDEEEAALETNRFGKRIGESRWVFQKQALVDYYHELLDNPERIAAIYMSMKPDYNEEGEIAGYRLEKEGESAFFDAVGLQEGDKIRKVNSMNMVSQARGEYFISEFMKDRLGAVVIDVERDGQEQKLIYLFR